MVIVGAITAIAVSAQSLFKWQDNWLKFRRTSEGLERERFLYQTRTGPYRGLDEDDVLFTLTARVEAMLSEEHTEWRQTNLGKP